MSNAKTDISGGNTLVTLAAGDIIKKNSAGNVAKVATAASTVGLGIVYNGVTSSTNGKDVSYVLSGKTKAYAGVATNGTAIEVGTPLIIGTGSTRGAGQVVSAAGASAAATTIVGKALEAVGVNTVTAQETLIDIEVDF